jgi:hypothetical protein
MLHRCIARVAALALGGCSSEKEITVSGTVVSMEGGPIAGAEVYVGDEAPVTTEAASAKCGRPSRKRKLRSLPKGVPDTAGEDGPLEAARLKGRTHEPRCAAAPRWVRPIGVRCLTIRVPEALLDRT